MKEVVAIPLTLLPIWKKNVLLPNDTINMSTSQNITEKVYRKLIILAGLQGFSFTVVDTLLNRIEFVKQVDFDTVSKADNLEKHYLNAFLENEHLTDVYDHVMILHENNLNSFVPKSLFDADFMPSYLQYNIKVFETDTFAHDELRHTELINVFVPFANINNFLLDQYNVFDFKHFSSILVEKLLERTINIEQKQVFAYLRKNNFEIIVAENQKLILYNSFEITNEADFIYYLLFTAEQLQLNTEHFELSLLGNISADDEYYKIAYKYVRNTELLDVTELQKHNNLNTADNLKHFVLLQS